MPQPPLRAGLSLTVLVSLAAAGEACGHEALSPQARPPEVRDVDSSRDEAPPQPNGASAADQAGGAMAVNSDSSAPSSPIDLSLSIRLLDGDRALSISARAGRRTGFPAGRFHDKDVTIRIELPPGLELTSGSLAWTGELKGEQTGEIHARAVAVREMEAIVVCIARGTATAGGMAHSDIEQFYVQARDGQVKVSREPLGRFGLDPPPIAGQGNEQR